ncbi:hypothetical protein, partial [Sphingomonas endophytica]|uniref:hypothetical protein n=1 Tax=Sphingomonas endophytica TaxID=869719 RepID=UPI0019D34623
LKIPFVSKPAVYLKINTVSDYIRWARCDSLENSNAHYTFDREWVGTKYQKVECSNSEDAGIHSHANDFRLSSLS